jgi:hypothetical protein
MIRLFDGHLDVQPNEFTEMSMSMRILSSEDMSDFKNTLEVSL